MTRLATCCGWTILVASACAASAPPTPTDGSRARSDEACSSITQAGVSTATSQRLDRASNIFEYENIWREEHPGSTLGTVSRSDISSFIRAKTPQIQDCYESALNNLPDGHGRVVTRFVIDATGNVPNVGITSNDFNDAHVGCCLAKRIAQWVFPVPTNGDFVVVEYPFVVRISHGK